MEKKYLEILVLAQINEEPKHAYEIAKNINQIFVDSKKINNNIIYPLMKRLVSDKYLSKEILVQEGKPNRKVYTITNSGKRHLLELLASFDKKDAADDMEFYTRILLLDYLNKDQIANILDLREEYLLNHKKFYEQYKNRDAFIFDNEEEMLLHLQNILQHDLEFIIYMRSKYLSSSPKD